MILKEARLYVLGLRFNLNQWQLILKKEIRYRIGIGIRRSRLILPDEELILFLTHKFLKAVDANAFVNLKKLQNLYGFEAGITRFFDKKPFICNMLVL